MTGFRTAAAAALAAFLLVPDAPGQKPAESPGGKALAEARQEREKRLAALGLKDGRVEIQGGDRAKVEEVLKKLHTEVPKVEEAFLERLRRLNKEFAADPAVNRIRWALAQALFSRGKGKEARKILETLGPSGMELEDRLDAIRLLVNLGIQEQAATMAAGLDPAAIPSDQTRYLVLAVLAATGGAGRALAGLAAEFKGVEDGEEMWEIADELERRFLLYPPSLHRPLLAALYEDILRRYPDAPGAGARRDLLAGLKLRTGSPAVPLAGKDLEGKPLALADFQGKVVLLHFWASWQKDSLAEAEKLKKTLDAAGKKGLAILGISLDKPAAVGLQAAREKKLPWRSLCDGETWQSAFVRAYAIKRIPFTILVDREGRVAGLGLAGEELEARLKDLLE